MPPTLRLLERIAHGALERAHVGKLVRVVEDDLGLALHRAVEGAKLRLSERTDAQVALAAIELDLPVGRGSFEHWICSQP